MTERPLWQIKEDTTHGTSFRAIFGRTGHPGTIEIGGLSKMQAENLGRALGRLEEKVEYRTKSRIRDALGIQGG